MEPRDLILKLKDRIKTLSAEQKKLKARMHINHDLLRKERKDFIEKEMKEKNLHYSWEVKNAPMGPGELHWRTIDGAAEITAALNVYLEMRGKKYRHGVKEIYKSTYESDFAQIRAEFMLHPAWRDRLDAPQCP